MVAAGHHECLAGVADGGHILTIRLASRHGRGRQPLQRQTHQHGEQHDQPGKLGRHGRIMRITFVPGKAFLAAFFRLPSALQRQSGTKNPPQDSPKEARRFSQQTLAKTPLFIARVFKGLFAF